MSDLNVVYGELKFWLPFITIGTLVWKARAAVNGWAEKLFTNHLHHIEKATIETVEETKKTNGLLKESSGKLDMVQNTLSTHHDKQLQVWQGVVGTLSVLEDRTRPTKRKYEKRKK